MKDAVTPCPVWCSDACTLYAASPAARATEPPIVMSAATASEPNTFIRWHFFNTARYLLTRFPTAPFDNVMTASSLKKTALRRSEGHKKSPETGRSGVRAIWTWGKGNTRLSAMWSQTRTASSQSALRNRTARHKACGRNKNSPASPKGEQGRSEQKGENLSTKRENMQDPRAQCGTSKVDSMFLL